MAAVLAAGLLAPASAGPAPDSGSGSLNTRAVVHDVRGDADGGTARARRLADLRRVSYRMPSTREGTMTVRARWVDLRGNGGSTQQTLAVFLDGRSSSSDGAFAIAGPTTPVAFYYFPEGSTEPRRVVPEEVDLRRSFGRGGLTRVTVSTEWLDSRRVRVDATSFADVLDRPGRGFGFDGTRGRSLRVGPLP